MNARQNAVVMHNGNFWVGGARWSAEYPDARLLTEEAAADKARQMGSGAVAIVDYGTTDERAVRS